MPHGVALIMSPWNYPYLLSVEPLIDATAAGNTVILKPSAYSPATSAVGLGGMGGSGMGAYHGKTGFDAFTHYKSIVDKKTWLDLNMRYRPYTKLGEKMIRTFLK